MGGNYIKPGNSMMGDIMIKVAQERASASANRERIQKAAQTIRQSKAQGKSSPYAGMKTSDVITKMLVGGAFEPPKELKGFAKFFTPNMSAFKRSSTPSVEPPSSYREVSGVQSTNYDPGPNVWDVADIQSFDPNRFATIDYGQGNVTVNAAVADRYQGFLKDLQATGYPLRSVGGQVSRPVRGGTRPSLHSYGLAIDVNPDTNPMTNRLVTDMPSNIRDIAAKYGLVWGGDWRGSRKDAMHFSFPFAGGK